MRHKWIILALAFVVLLASDAAAQSIIGVSPGNVDLKNVLRGGYAERAITVTVDSESPVKVKLEPRGDIVSWLDFSTLELEVSRGSPGRPVIYVTPPTDVPNGNYTAFLRVRTEEINPEGKQGHATGKILAALDVVITVEITDLEVFACEAKNFKIDSVEKGEELKIELDFLNKGNIRVSPKVVVDIWDLEYSQIVKTLDLVGSEVLPTKTEKVAFSADTNELEVMQYWAEVSAVECYASEVLTFDIFEPGTLRAEGIITGIASMTWTSEGEIVPITVNFKNTGEKEIVSQFKGQITLDGKIVQLLEGEQTSVPVNEATNFTFFFTPGKEGKYIVSGRVFYEKKRTFEASTVVNVTAKDSLMKKAFLVIAYIAFSIVVLMLLYKIRKEKRRLGYRI